MATVEDNKELVRRVIESGVNTGDLDVFRAHLSDDYARHSQATTEMQEIRGIEEMVQFLEEQFAIFPDWHEEIELIIGEGPFVGCVTRGRGTQRGPMGEIPPTGREIEITNFIFHRIDGGKIAETWIGWDNVAALMQLGLMGETQPDGS